MVALQDLPAAIQERITPTPVPVLAPIPDVLPAEGDCWYWDFGFSPSMAYGRLNDQGRSLRAHRAIWEWFVGSIDDGMVLDHRCRVTRCVNPAHLEEVTVAENNRRARFFAVKRSHKLRCKSGHLFDKDNTHWTAAGTQVCRACRRATAERRRAVEEKRLLDNERMRRRSAERRALMAQPFIGPAEPPEACSRGHRRVPGLGHWVVTGPGKVSWRCLVCSRRSFRKAWGYGDDVRSPAPRTYERCVAAAYECALAGVDPVFSEPARGTRIPANLAEAIEEGQRLAAYDLSNPPKRSGPGGKHRKWSKHASVISETTARLI